jgi:hypothetical protein
VHSLVTALINLLEWLFLIGLTGAAFVLVLTTIEDVETMMEKDEPSEPAKPEQAGD